MCGIIGILGAHEVSPLLVEALKRMEYRGYDSAGVATVADGRLDRRRAEGKLINLSDALVHEPLPGHSGIGHTRWATHGAATLTNAHPHQAGRVAVVHNGIIENFRELRAEAEAAGLTASSETDTEVVALLVEAGLMRGQTPVEAVTAVLPRLRGAYALAFLFAGEDDLMIGARMGSPLAVGVGEGEMFLGSDAIALAPLTTELVYLEEGDMAVLTRAGAALFDQSGRPVSRPTTHIQPEHSTADKRGYKHFMAKEIAEQPGVLSGIIETHCKGDALHWPEAAHGLFEGIERVLIVACGTASLAGSVAKYWMERVAKLPVDVDIASEYRYRDSPVAPHTLAIFVSQSGETADTLAALRHVKGRAARVVGLTNVATSTIAREADLNLPIQAGVEIGVASTKAFTAQLTMLWLLTLEAARARGALDAAGLAARLEELRALPGLVSHALTLDAACQQISAELSEATNALFLGRDWMFPLAQEAALKLKEISYIHAEAYASGELKHGPIALIDHHMPVVVLAPHDAIFEKTISNMQEVMARGGPVYLISDAAGHAMAGDGPVGRLTLPAVPDALAPILYAIPAQLLAYHTAIAKGTDVDQPRNLAKSVTVE